MSCSINKKRMKINDNVIKIQLDTIACQRLRLCLVLVFRQGDQPRLERCWQFSTKPEPFSLIGKEGLKDPQKNMTFSIFNEASVHQIKSYLPESLFQTLGNIGIMFSNPSSWVRRDESRVSPFTDHLFAVTAPLWIHFLTCQMAVVIKPDLQACL